MVLDEPTGARRDEIAQGIQASDDMVLEIDPFTHIVQQCRQQEFFVVRYFFTSQTKHL